MYLHLLRVAVLFGLSTAPVAAAELLWLDDYSTAYQQAAAEKKLLLVAFDSADASFEPDRQAADAMKDLVLVRLRVENSTQLLCHAAFREFHCASGVGIIDLKHDGDDNGRVVQVLPSAHLTMEGVRTMIAMADRRPAPLKPRWHTDYLAARAEAEAKGRMLLVAVDSDAQSFEPRPKSHPVLCSYVLLRQTTESKYDSSEGEPRRLLDYADFQPLRNQPGVVVYDFKHKDRPYHGEVVSVMPCQYLGPNSGKHVFSEEEREQELLTLEPNTLSRRTLTWAIRVSKGNGGQRLRSADGRPCEIRMQGARRNSQLQCRSGVGHFAGGLTGPEIAAPGSGRDIVDSALNMVRLWCTSPPHYGVMVRFHPQFGYDMSASSSNHWYGTGRF